MIAVVLCNHGPMKVHEERNLIAILELCCNSNSNTTGMPVTSCWRVVD